jgi:hypothetical protein
MSDPVSASAADTSGLKYAIFLPTFSGHFHEASQLLHSLKCLCVDIDDVDIYVIVSDTKELHYWRQMEEEIPDCGRTFSRFNTPSGNIGRATPKTTIVNLYDILPARFHNSSTVFPHDTSAILRDHGKYAYQSIKKMAAALEFDYDFGLWLDSEALAVQPFSMRKVFDDYVKAPTIWRSRMVTSDFMKSLVRAATRTLGRSVDSFGPLAWYLESVMWIVEKGAMKDMADFIEHAHKGEFWDIWLRNDHPFEVLIYNMHIATRKLETTDPMFAKYRVLESEREMIRFGIAPAFPHMENRDGTGFIERGFLLLEDATVRPNLAAFLQRHSQRLLRLENLNILPPDEMDQFLFDAVDLLVCGAPDLYGWWAERAKNGTLGSV